MRSAPIFFFVILLSGSAFSQKVEWASKVEEYSSEISGLFFSAQQIIGKPNVNPFGEENPNAWTPSRPTRIEFIKVGFDKPMKIRQVTIIESYGPGSLYRIYAYDRSENEYLLMTLDPKAVALTGRVKNVFVPLTTYEVASIKLVVDGSSVDGYSSIDAIAISDLMIPIVPEINIAKNVRSDLAVQRLGDNVNSDDREVGPVLAPDGKTIFFSRQAHEGNEGGVNDAEDIWYSELDTATGEWQIAKNIGVPLNNEYPNFVSSVTNDGNSILLILGNRYIDGKKPKIGVSISTKQGDTWTLPKAIEIEDDYNLSYNVDYYMGNSRKVLVMAYERDDSYGERDLYVSFNKKDNTWTAPMNIGKKVNTLGEEAAPFLASDEKTLYFTTSGYKGFGKSDIYVTTRLDDTWKNWSEPQNLGPEVNTSLDESYFSVPTEGDYAYFTREVAEGNDDIFRVKLPLFHMPTPVVTVRGRVLNSKNQVPVGARIYYERLSDGKEMGYATADSITGEYTMILPSGEQYGFRAEAPDMIAVSQNIDLRKLVDNEKILQNLTLTPLEKGEKIVLNNIFFAFDKFTLFDESKPELNYVANILKENEKVMVEIAGHTDSKGSDVYNLKLSQNRANTVTQFLLNQGIAKERLKVVGYGETTPTETNETDEGRAKNRRVEFKILEN